MLDHSLGTKRYRVNLFVPNAPYGFLMFSGSRERVHWERMGYALTLQYFYKKDMGLSI